MNTVHVHICTCVYVYMMCVYIFINGYTYIHIHVYIHITYTHQYTHSRMNDARDMDITQCTWQVLYPELLAPTQQYACVQKNVPSQRGKNPHQKRKSFISSPKRMFKINNDEQRGHGLWFNALEYSREVTACPALLLCAHLPLPRAEWWNEAWRSHLVTD